MTGSTENHPISLLALGRSIKLGMLQSIRTDSPIPGFTLWKQDNLDANVYKSYTNATVFPNFSKTIVKIGESTHLNLMLA